MLRLGLRYVRSNWRPRPLGLQPLSTQYPSFQPPKPTISQRIWYRHDGTPRSKTRGLVIGGVSTVLLLLIYTMFDLLDELQTACASLIFLVHVQRVDHQYSGKDLKEMANSLAYFESLFRPFVDNEGDLDYILGRFSDMDSETKAAVHELLRSLHQRLHYALRDSVGKEGEVCFEIQEIVEDVLQKMMAKLQTNLKDKAIKMRREPRPEKEEGYDIVG